MTRPSHVSTLLTPPPIESLRTLATTILSRTQDARAPIQTGTIPGLVLAPLAGGAVDAGALHFDIAAAGFGLFGRAETAVETVAGADVRVAGLADVERVLAVTLGLSLLIHATETLVAINIFTSWSLVIDHIAKSRRWLALLVLQLITL